MYCQLNIVNENMCASVSFVSISYISFLMTSVWREMSLLKGDDIIIGDGLIIMRWPYYREMTLF